MMVISKSLLNPSHLLEFKPWPIIAGFTSFNFVLSFVWMFMDSTTILFFINLVLLLFVFIGWRIDVLQETMLGFHNNFISFGFRFGMILFIRSEVLFFFSFFWGFFHSEVSLDREFGLSMPPLQFHSLVIDPFSVPLLNSIILLSSGITVTFAHHSLQQGVSYSTTVSLFFTMSLGFFFLYLQICEYVDSSLSVNSFIYGRIFFMLTGFHGFHVLVGSILLLICFIRSFFRWRREKHVGFEASAWYWHFVDVVWLFLYFFVYWLGFFI